MVGAFTAADIGRDITKPKKDKETEQIGRRFNPIIQALLIHCVKIKWGGNPSDLRMLNVIWIENGNNLHMDIFYGLHAREAATK